MREGRSAQKRIHCKSLLKLNQNHTLVTWEPAPRVPPEVWLGVGVPRDGEDRTQVWPS